MSEFELREDGEIWRRKYNPMSHNTMWEVLQPLEIFEILKEQEEQIKTLAYNKERFEEANERERAFRNGVEAVKKILELAKND